MVRTWAYTIAESVCQREAHCNAQFSCNCICEIWLDICRFSAFWKTPPEKVENRSQVFGLVSKTFFSQWSSIISLPMKCLKSLTVCSGRPYEHVHAIRIEIRPIRNLKPMAVINSSHGERVKVRFIEWMGLCLSYMRGRLRKFIQEWEWLI
jgi:hypothetical protein